MKEVQFIQTSPSELANILSEQLRAELRAYAAQLNELDAIKDGEEVMTRKKTREILDVSYVTLNEWTKAGILHGHKLGNRVFYRRSHLMEVLAKSNPKTA